MLAFNTCVGIINFFGVLMDSCVGNKFSLLLTSVPIGKAGLLHAIQVNLERFIMACVVTILDSINNKMNCGDKIVLMHTLNCQFHKIVSLSWSDHKISPPMEYLDL